MNPTTKDQLNTLAQHMLDGGVGLALKNESNATHLVMGTGNYDADVVFIGEAPGEEEDLQGKPFVGAAGKFVNTVFGELGMNRDDFYITNIVKYRPPENRDPSPEEIAEFAPHLESELQIVKPRLLVTFGRISLGHFVPEGKIKTIHGQLQRVQLGQQALPLMPLLHPSALRFIKNGRQVFRDDFKLLKEEIDRLT
ncbi:hypothetical protein BGO17_03750 [Candidatus Saccharibacteria bacterium 49-20]|nr:MAG: hypothetical protein BGO17_03750 [Candidatus Saccharibacteria bacterium 49-20]